MNRIQQFMRKIFSRDAVQGGEQSQADQGRSPEYVSTKPQHVAVIMDGNGRWANAKGLSRVAGHKEGANSVKSLIRVCREQEIPFLTIFAFSSENWNRPAGEVNALMELFNNALETQIDKLNENGVRLRFLGDLSKFSEAIQARATAAELSTVHNTDLVFSVAVNYGGRWDITQACRALAEQVKAGQLSVSDIDEASISQQLSTNQMPDPDFFIRTSGEHRISNFLLWQSAYAEFYFTETLWPDFDESAFIAALADYSQRDRRFGGAIDKPSGTNAS